MKHQHIYRAVPITGQNVWSGKEELLGWRAECETCYKQPKKGDVITKIVKSWWGEIVPRSKLLTPPVEVTQ